MKTIAFSPKIIALTWLMALAFIIPSKAQENGKTEAVNALQAGTVTLVNGKATIILNEQVTQQLSVNANSPEYIVSITTETGCGIVQIDKKNNDSFTVSETPTEASKANSGTHTFEYVVFIKILNNSRSTQQSTPRTTN
jgi:hypothetical protein